MSRVIKAALWKDKPCIVEAPLPPPPPEPAEGKESVGWDEASQAALREEIQTQKKQAEQLLAETAAACEAKRKEAQAQQESLLAEARKQAETIRAEAASAGREDGFAAGHAEGLATAREEEKQAVLKANAQAEKTLADAGEAEKAYVQQAEEEITDIALHVVGKVLPQHFIDVPQVILPLVRKALLKIKDQNEVIVHVAPAHYDLVMMARMEFQGLLEGEASLTVKSDASLAPGDCVLESPNGNVDARLATQLDLIKKAVQDVML